MNVSDRSICSYVCLNQCRQPPWAGSQNFGGRRSAAERELQQRDLAQLYTGAQTAGEGKRAEQKGVLRIHVCFGPQIAQAMHDAGRSILISRRASRQWRESRPPAAGET